jgi:hypothetical protein
VEDERERRDGRGSDEDYWKDPERDMSEGVGDSEPGSEPGDLTYHTRPQPLTQRPRAMRRARRTKEEACNVEANQALSLETKPTNLNSDSPQGQSDRGQCQTD